MPLHLVVPEDTLCTCGFHLRKNCKTLIERSGSLLLIYFVRIVSVRHQFLLRVQRIGQVLAYLCRLICGDHDPSIVLVSQVSRKALMPHRAPSA
jgi:hypothetical protein